MSTDRPAMFIHIGFPKTATTTLQDNVFPNHRGVNYLGKSRHLRGVDKSILYDRAKLFVYLWKQKSTEYDPQYVNKLSRNCLRPFVSNEKANVISMEEFSYATPRRLDVPGRLKDVFGPVGIIMTVRSQYDSLVSAYYWKYMNLELNQPFDRWFASMMACADEPLCKVNQPLNLPRFCDLAQEYITVFGRENVCVLPFEWLRDNTSCFAERLSGFLGIDAGSTLELLQMKRRNVRLSRAAIRYQRLIRKLNIAVAKYVIPIKARTRIGYYHNTYTKRGSVITRLLNFFFSTASRDLTAEQRAFILDYYGTGNGKLAEMFGLDMEKYGYPLLSRTTK